MLKEIQVEGVGTMRHLTDWQIARLQRLRGPNRAIAPMAFGLGMTYQQFRGLTPEQQQACKEAFGRLIEPPPFNREKRVR